MEIKTLIEVFQQFIPHYKKAIDENYTTKGLRNGICYAVLCLTDYDIYSVFTEGYY